MGAASGSAGSRSSTRSTGRRAGGALTGGGSGRAAIGGAKAGAPAPGAGEPNVGVCLDVFHYYKGPSKPEDLDRLTAKNLAHVQLCDVAGVPRELMTDADRVFPGEGDFRLGDDAARPRHPMAL